MAEEYKRGLWLWTVALMILSTVLAAAGLVYWLHLISGGV